MLRQLGTNLVDGAVEVVSVPVADVDRVLAKKSCVRIA